MPSRDKNIMLQKAAKLIIKITKKYHNPERDLVSELYSNNLYINGLLGQEMERIRMKERGEIQ